MAGRFFWIFRWLFHWSSISRDFCNYHIWLQEGHDFVVIWCGDILIWWVMYDMLGSYRYMIKMYDVSCQDWTNKDNQYSQSGITYIQCSSHTHTHMGVSINVGTPKSYISMGFSLVNHPFEGYHHLWIPHIQAKAKPDLKAPQARGSGKVHPGNPMIFQVGCSMFLLDCQYDCIMPNHWFIGFNIMSFGKPHWHLGVLEVPSRPVIRNQPASRYKLSPRPVPGSGCCLQSPKRNTSWGLSVEVPGAHTWTIIDLYFDAPWDHDAVWIDCEASCLI